MVKADPSKARILLPDAFFIAIGKVCVQWTSLEYIAELVLIKLTGMEHDDVRGKIVVNHMSWPQKTDIISALIEQLSPQYSRLEGYETEVVPLLRKAQEGRNRIVHGGWAVENEKVILLRATARAKLKLHMDEITVTQIEEIVQDIHKAVAAIYNKVIGTDE